MTTPSANPTPITPPRVPLIDQRTGLIDRAWYMYFLSLFNAAQTAVDGQNLGPDAASLAASLEFALQQTTQELQSQPVSVVEQIQPLLDSIAQQLDTLPRPELGTMAALQQANVPWLTFDTTADVTPPDVGTVAWDGGTTLGVQMTPNVLLKVGEAEYIYAKASAIITKGQVCYHTGAVGSSGVITVAPAPIGLTDPNQIVGIAAESIALNDFGLIQISGDIKGFDTTGSSVGEVWADGDPLYYNPAYVGRMTKNKPSAPNQKTYIGEVINAGSGGSGSMHIRIVQGSVLGGTDSNVQFGALADGNLIQYDSALQYWKNVAPSSVAVTSFSAGTTGLTPNIPTTGNVVLGGTLQVASGGTGLTSGTTNGIVYFSSASTIANSSNFIYDSVNNLQRITAPGPAYQLQKSTGGIGARFAFNVDYANAAEISVFDGSAWSANFVLDYVTGFAAWRLSSAERMRLTTTGLSHVGSAGVVTRTAATRDGIALVGNGVGTNSWSVSLTPATLSASRTVTFPDSNTTIPIASQVITFSGPTAARTYTLPDASVTLAGLATTQTFSGTNTFTGANSFQNASGQTFLASTTTAQDGVVINGRAGGTGSFRVTIQPGTLSASRTVTLPDASTTIPVATQVLTFSGPTAARTYTLPDANATLLSTNATVTVPQGGTGATTFTANGVLFGNTTSAIGATAAGTTGQVLVGNTGAAPSWGNATSVAVTSLSFGTTGLTPSAATQGAITVAGTLVAANGGTGQSSYTIGDLLYASGTTALAKLAGVATGNALISGGVGAIPSWGKIGLTTHVSGTLPVANGGTGLTTGTANGILYFSSTSAIANSSNFIYDSVNNLQRITATSPAYQLQKSAATIGARFAFNVDYADAAEMSVFDGAAWSANFILDYVTGFAAWRLSSVERMRLTSTSLTQTGTGGILTRSAATQDGVILQGRAGGTTSLAVTLTPTTLTASRTLTLPDNSGTLLTTGATITVPQGGTGLTSGTSGGLPYFNATNTMASSGLLAANALVVGGGAGAAPATITTGTGVTTALGVNTGTAGAFVVNGGALGTPSSGTLTNATGLPISTGVSGLGTGVATALAVNVGTAGAFVTNGGALGTPSSGTVTNLTGTASININGTVGATTPNTGAFTTLSASGNVSLNGSAQRITGDFSNATQTNRAIFQSSTVNGNTAVGSLPNGTATTAGFTAYNTSDPANSSILNIFSTSTDTRVASTSAGTGSVLPFRILVGGSEQAAFGGTGASMRTAGSFATGVPVTVNAATYTVTQTDFAVRFTTTNCTVTLPTASSFNGRILMLSTVTANSVTSASSNVVPLGSSTAGTAILAATAGKFAMLQSDGSNWFVLMSN